MCIRKPLCTFPNSLLFIYEIDSPRSFLHTQMWVWMDMALAGEPRRETIISDVGLLSRLSLDLIRRRPSDCLCVVDCYAAFGFMHMGWVESDAHLSNLFLEKDFYLGKEMYGM